MKLLPLSAILIFVTITGSSALLNFEGAGSLPSNEMKLGISYEHLRMTVFSPIESNGYGMSSYLGLKGKLDAGISYLLLQGDSDASIGNLHVFSLGVKIPVMGDRIAVFLPFSFSTGRGVQNLQTVNIQPGINLALPIRNILQLNLSPQFTYGFGKDGGFAFIISYGFAISNNLSKWSLNPTGGLLFTPMGESLQKSFGLSLNYHISFPTTPGNKSEQDEVIIENDADIGR